MRRKGVPCACNPCKGKNYVRAVNNVSPDPNGDLTIRGGAGIEIIQSGDDLVINNTANPNAFVAGRNIELNPSGDDIAIDLVDEPVVDGLTVNGDLEVNGDIIQNGSAYETHAEHVFTRDDYIIMRDGAVSGLPQGDYSGFQVKLYDGVNDGRLVIDRDGTARVGDVGDEQPLLTRDESANLVDGALLKWDATNQKAIDEGTIGTDTKPIKIVNGVAIPVDYPLVDTSQAQVISGFKTITSNEGLQIKTNNNVAAEFKTERSGTANSSFQVVHNGNNFAIMYVQMDDSGTAYLTLGKYVNGVFSTTTVASM